MAQWLQLGISSNSVARELLENEIQPFRFVASTGVDNQPALVLFGNVGFKIIVGNAVVFWLGFVSNSTIKPREISLND